MLQPIHKPGAGLEAVRAGSIYASQEEQQLSLPSVTSWHGTLPCLLLVINSTGLGLLQPFLLPALVLRCSKPALNSSSDLWFQFLARLPQHPTTRPNGHHANH